MNGNASHPPPVLSASSNGLYESDNPSDWQPYRDGEAAIRDAHKNLSSDDWYVAYLWINLSMFEVWKGKDLC